MTDTGQIPVEGLPENAGVVDRPGVPGPGAYTALDPSGPRPAEPAMAVRSARAAHTDDDLLLMPGAQGAWVDPQSAPGGQQPSPAQPPTAVQVAQPGPGPAAGPAGPPGQVPVAGVPQPGPYGAEGAEAVPAAVPAPRSAADGTAPDAGPLQAPVPGELPQVGVVTAPGLVAPTDLGSPESAVPAGPGAPSIQVVAEAPAAVDPSAAGAPVAAPAPEQQGQEQMPQQNQGAAPEQPGIPAEAAEDAAGAENGVPTAAADGVPAEAFVPGPQGEQSAPGFPPGSATPTPPPGRRPLHMGPPVPDHSTGVVRSLADRGPAGVAPHPLTAQPNSGPPTLGPEYLDVPRDEAPLPGPQLAEIPPQAGVPWDAVPPQSVTSQSVVPDQPEPVAAEAVAPDAAAEVPAMPAEAIAPAEAAGPAPVAEPVAPVAAPEAAEAAEPVPPVEDAPEQQAEAGAPVAAAEADEAVEAPSADTADGADATGETAESAELAEIIETPAEAPETVSVESAAPEAPAAPQAEAPAEAAEPEAPVAAEEAAVEAAAEQPVQEAEAAVPQSPQPAAEPATGPEAVAPDGPESAPVAAGTPAEAPAPESPEATEAPASAEVVEPAAEAPAEAVPTDADADAAPVTVAAEPPAETVAAADATAPEPLPAEAGPEAPAADAATATEAVPETIEAEPATADAPAEAAPEAEAPAEPAEAVAPAGPEAVAETETAPAPQAVAEPAAEEATAGQDTAEEATAGEPVAPAARQTPPAPGYDDAEREAVLKVMRERRDIRNGFRDDPIPHDVLLRVLEAAHTAPSVGHSQPWDFVVIRSAETRATMHELAERQRDAYAKSLPKARAKQFKELKIEAILDTPVNIVVTADPTRGGRHTLGRHTQPQMAPYSSALAVENLWLAARAEGLGVGWVSFFDEREMVRALGLPEHLEVVAYLCVGYVDEFPEEPELVQAGWSKRRPLSWVVHEETYGRRVLPGAEPHDLLQETVAAIRPLDAKALGEAWERQKRMTKPAGALGMLEIISAQLSGLSRMCPPPIPEPAAVAVFAGDHGVHAQGVTAWPQEVTAQMVTNFLAGGAVVNAFATQVGAEVCVVDVGVASELPARSGLLPRKVRAGTADFTAGPALTREEVVAAIEVGVETARDLVAAGNKALLTGEMGIANTTVSAALICVYTGGDPAEITGRGTGINDETHARKIDVVRRGLELHAPDPADPIGVLAAFGGLEHAATVGLILGGASLRTPVVLDGVSAGAAALVARAIAPEALSACIAGHRSAEPGHVAALTKLGLRPLVDLDLRLGEGTGALLALPVVQSAARAMHEVATFDSAGVTEK